MEEYTFNLEMNKEDFDFEEIKNVIENKLPNFLLHNTVNFNSALFILDAAWKAYDQWVEKS